MKKSSSGGEFGFKTREARELLNTKIKHMKAQKIVLGDNEMRVFKSFCIDVQNYHMFFETVRGDLSAIDLNALNKLNQEEEEIDHLKNNSDFLSIIKLANRDQFMKKGESIVKLNIFEKRNGNHYLIIVSNFAIYALLIDLFILENSARSVDNNLKIETLYSLSEESDLLVNYCIHDVHLKTGRITLHLRKTDDSPSRNSNSLLVDMQLEDMFKEDQTFNETKENSGTNENANKMKISYCPVFNQNVNNFAVDQSVSDTIYVVIENKVFKGKLKTEDLENVLKKNIQQPLKDQNGDESISDLQLIFTKKTEITRFKLLDKEFYLKDKKNRVVKVNADSGIKTMMFELQKGEVEQFELDPSHKTIFM